MTLTDVLVGVGKKVGQATLPFYATFTFWTGCITLEGSDGGSSGNGREGYTCEEMCDRHVTECNDLTREDLCDQGCGTDPYAFCVEECYDNRYTPEEKACVVTAPCHSNLESCFDR